MTTPYTYLIGWTHLNKWYYGVRYAKGCNPTELWKTYFTSSKHVKEFRAINGEPDVVEIRKTFDCAKSSQRWENKVLKSMRVVSDEKWLNKTDNLAIDTHLASNGWKNIDPIVRKARSSKAGAAANVLMTDNQKANRLQKSIDATKEWWSKKSKEERAAHSRIGGLAAASKLTEDQRQYRLLKLREKHQIVSECPHCGKSGKGTVMKKWHFDNCKMKGN